MGHLGDMKSIPTTHLTVVSRMLASLPQNDLERLHISPQLQTKVKQLIQNNLSQNANQLLDANIIQKLSFLGTVEQFYTFFDNFQNYKGA